MTRIHFPPRRPPRELGHLPDQLSETTERRGYTGVKLQSAILHDDIVETSADDDLFGDGHWANLATIAVFESEESDSYFEYLVDHDKFCILEARLDPDDFQTKIEQVSETGIISIGDHEIPLIRSTQLDGHRIKTRYRSSDSNRYDGLDRHYPSYVYELNTLSFTPQFSGEEITDQSTPGPLGLTSEDPPALNLYDAVTAHMGIDGRSGYRMHFVIFQPYYDYRILEVDYSRRKQNLTVHLDGRDERIGAQSPLSIQVISHPRDWDEELRIQREVTSHYESIDVDRLTTHTYVVLTHAEEGVIDIREVRPPGPSESLTAKAEELKETQPFMAAALSRMALLRFLRKLCGSYGIFYTEDEEVPELSHKLNEEGVLPGHTHGQITESWFDLLSKAAKLRRSEVEAREVERAVNDVLRFISEWGRNQDGGENPTAPGSLSSEEFP